MGASSLAPEGWTGWTFWIGAATLAVGTLVVARDEKRLVAVTGEANHLHAANERLWGLLSKYEDDYFDRFRTMLSLIATELGLDQRDRVTVFRRHDKFFLMLGRYSATPGYNRQGRRIYPVDQGLVARAWERGEAWVEDLPDWQSEWKKYVDKQARWGLSEQETEQLTMKSRSYYACCIPGSKPGQNVGVIVLESEGPRRLRSLTARLKQYAGQVATYIRENAHLEPEPGAAAERGL